MATETALCEFVAKLGSEGLRHRTMKVYLSAIRHLEAIPESHEQAALHPEGRKSTESRVRLPITPCILRKMREGWDRRAGNHDIRMLWAASCLGYFGFLIESRGDDRAK